MLSDRYTSTLVTNLHIVLHKLLGLSSLKVPRQSTLGMSAIEVSTRAGSKYPVAKARETKLQTSFPTICQYYLKKIPWNPSGPRDLGYVMKDCRNFLA